MDAENYSNINAFPGSHHKHCDEAKTEVPADCLEFTQMIWRCHLGIGPVLQYVRGKPANESRRPWSSCLAASFVSLVVLVVKCVVL